ncbi:MAG: membrane protein insertase YidC [Eubacterium sp.]|nr:membrane protein insertase YidC [Eubacterium sp.]
MHILYQVLERIMYECYCLCHNYGYAILLFTLLSKIVLLPLSIWVQKNSIKMVRMQPEINFMKAEYFGDSDKIAQEQSRLFKEERYHPLLSVVPLAVQVVLLALLVNVLKAGMEDPKIDMDFLGLQLGQVPAHEGGMLLLSPVAAGISAWILCMAQNASNVLQSEQAKWNKYGMLLLSVALSVYLGWFVSVGVVVYWVASNLMAVAQLYLLNWLVNPKKYIDYKKLEDSRQILAKLENIGRKKKRSFIDPDSRREKEDYKRFFSVVNKHLVFYSESSGFYKYYQGIIEYILDHTNIMIHYITSDPQDVIFELSKTEENIRAYYIAEKRLITLMMKMDADMVVMTMPDLESYHIKRSYVRKDIEYLYVQHGMGSVNMTFRKGALDHFDTVLCVGKHQKEEVEKTEEAYGLAKKRLLECGYPLLDEMRREYGYSKKEAGAKKTILIAPSWQEGNIVESCLEGLLDCLMGSGYHVTVRPHPQHVRHYPDQMGQLVKKYEAAPDIEIQTDFSSNQTVFEAGMLVTDWSDIAYEYAYTTCRPVLFINTPVKIMNPEYKRIGVEPLNIWVREKIGKVLEPNELALAASTIGGMFDSMDEYAEKIRKIVQEYVYHPGTSAQVAAEYIIGRLLEKAEERKGGVKNSKR